MLLSAWVLLKPQLLLSAVHRHAAYSFWQLSAKKVHRKAVLCCAVIVDIITYGVGVWIDSY
jgi:hypothetical protein